LITTTDDLATEDGIFATGVFATENGYWSSETCFANLELCAFISKL